MITNKQWRFIVNYISVVGTGHVAGRNQVQPTSGYRCGWYDDKSQQGDKFISGLTSRMFVII